MIYFAQGMVRTALGEDTFEYPMQTMVSAEQRPETVQQANVIHAAALALFRQQRLPRLREGEEIMDVTVTSLSLL